MRATFKTSFRSALGALLLLWPLLAPAPALAQDAAAQAKALFDKGLAKMDAGNYEVACQAIAESQKLDPRPGTLFTLATCEEGWGHIASAYARYGEYLAAYERLPPEKKAAQVQIERKEQATKSREKLLPEIPHITLSLPEKAPADTVVKLDGETVAQTALGVSLPVDPGEHVLSSEAPGGSVHQQRITITRGEKKAVTVEVIIAPSSATSSTAATSTAAVSTAAPPPTSPLLTSPGSSRSLVGPFVLFGAAAAGLGLGIGLGAAVLGKESELRKACPDKDCPVSQQAKLDGAKSLSYVATGGFVLAGVAAAAGVVWLALPAGNTGKSAKISFRLGPGHASVQGAF